MKLLLVLLVIFVVVGYVAYEVKHQDTEYTPWQRLVDWFKSLK